MDTNTNRTSKLPKIAFALAALISASAAAAQEDAGRASVRVHYGDLNLASDDGVKALDRRLDRAVKRVCGTPDPRMLHQNEIIRDCQQEARAGIVPQRTYAIARATGRNDGKEWAENSFGKGVTLSE